MAYQSLDLGTSADDGTGDSLRVGGDKINDNFSEIYTLLGTGTALTSGLSATATVVTLSSAVGTFTTLTPAAADGTALGSASLEFSDLFLADGAVINLGSDQDVTLTHVADTGILLNSTRQLQFGDSGTYIHQSADGVLDLVSDTELELNATTIDINGAVEISGTLAQVGVATFTARDIHSGGITIANGGQIGSVGDADAIAIASGGGVTLTQTLSGAAGTFSGILKTDDTTEATSTTDGSLQTDGGLSVAKDIVAGDDVKLLSDASVIAFGTNGDVTLTHVHDTGILLNSTMQLQFNDASQNINAPSATVLDINATDEIELNATLADVNANLDVSGTYTGGGLMTTGGNIVIPNAGNIGSVGDTDAIAIASGGGVTLTQTLSGAAGTFSGILKTDDTTEATSTTDGSLQTDGGLSVAKDIVAGDDVKLLSDSAVLSFGADSDTTLTHTDGSGLTLNSTNKIMFNDASQFIQGASATVLDIAATDEIELTATLIDVVGNLAGSGTGTFGGILKTDDTTAATSTTDGSLQTDGGLSVAADAVIGDDLKLLSDGAIITMGANSEINLTHVHDTGITTNGEFTSTVIRARKPIKTEFNTSSAVTASLTAAESGATVLIDGTENNIINLPAAATTNPGLIYDFVVLTAVASDKTTIVNIAGSGGNFVGALSLAGGTAANAVLDNAGDAFTFVNSTVIGSRARITCLTDDGTDGVWQVESLASPIATID